MSRNVPNRTHVGGHQPHVVIPYNYADHAFASSLTAALRRDHFTALIDDVDMTAGAFLVNRITQAARPVDCIVPAISNSSLRSRWVQSELKTVMTRSFQGRHIRVLPARIDDCALPDFLAVLPYADFHRNGWDAAYGDLIIAVQQQAGPDRTNPAQPSFGLPQPARLT